MPRSTYEPHRCSQTFKAYDMVLGVTRPAPRQSTSTAPPPADETPMRTRKCFGMETFLSLIPHE